MRSASHATARTTRRQTRAHAGVAKTPTVADFFGTHWRAAFGTEFESADATGTPYRQRYYPPTSGDGCS